MSDKRDEIVARFDSYTKTALRHCLYNKRLAEGKRAENEILLNFDKLCHYDGDNYDFLENQIKIMDFDIVIKNDLLYDALKSLKQHQRDIIYLSICENLSDKKISTIMNISRTTVQRIKVNVINELKNKMNGVGIDEK